LNSNTEMMRQNWKCLIDLGPKFVGTDAKVAAANYIYDQMQLINHNTYKQKFFFDGWQLKDDYFLESLAPEKRKIDCCVFLGSGGSHDVIEGKLGYIGQNMIWGMYNWERFGIIDSSGDIAGYVTVRSDGKAKSQTLMEGQSMLPHFIVGRAELEYFRDCLENNVELKLRGHIQTNVIKECQGENIVVPFESTSRSPKKVILCAHYDTMYNTAGAYDNAAGVAVVMEIARIIAQKNINRNIDVVLTDGEEWNLQGSSYYAQFVDKDNVEFIINVDGVGRERVLEVWCGPEWFEREIIRIINVCSINLKTIYKCPPQPGSDHAPFYNKGIPSCMLTFNDQYILHTPQDTYEESKYGNMKIMTQLVQSLFLNKGIIL
jgi:hypothetical protein